MDKRSETEKSGVELNKDGNSKGEETKNVRKEERRTGIEKEKEGERKKERRKERMKARKEKEGLEK
jgi:hypothetical protein